VAGSFLDARRLVMVSVVLGVAALLSGLAAIEASSPASSPTTKSGRRQGSPATPATGGCEPL
jgi:hypothetical protein